MPLSRIALLTCLAMLAFAGNSLLCRIALQHTTIDPATFTSLRLVFGAIALGVVVRWSSGAAVGGDWTSAGALFGYAACFSFAYKSQNLTAATGALLLFGAVQTVMMAHGLLKGERFGRGQIAGWLLALGGLVGLTAPGLSAPPALGAALMLLAGAAWGVYSLRGRGAGDPTRVTAGNFLRTLPFAAVLSLLTLRGADIDIAGAVCAIASGALTSGVGYAIWYRALPSLKATTAATVQLCVPVLTAMGGVAFLGESITLRLVLASAAILGGIALVIAKRVAPTNPAPAKQ